MDRYIGLDAHSQTCTVTVMGPSGKHLAEQILETNGKVLVEHLKGIAGTKHLCFEEGTHSEWLYELLKPQVDDLVVIQPLRSDGQKNDSVDAWGLAERVRHGAIDCAVFKAPGVYSELRAAVRAQRALVGDVVRAKNRLKAIYRSRGLQGMGTEVYDSAERSKWLKKLPVHRRKLAEILSKELDALTEVHASAKEWLLEQAGGCPIVKLLATAPGIGMIRAAQIVAIVLSPERFRTRQQFWSYCGLGIVTRSSSDWVRDRQGAWARRETAQTRGLNRNRHPVLKAIFKGAALSIVQSMPNHPLHQDYQRMISAGIKPTLARITVARKIAAAVLAMWKNKEEYDPAKSQRQPQPS
jgi:transposase